MLAYVSPTADPLAFHAHPETWFVIVFSGYLYWYAIRRLGPRVLGRGVRVATRRQIFYFCSGLFALEAAGDWPLHDLAENYLYSAHMVQHLLISFVAPPLLLLGVPAWLTRWLLRPLWAQGTVRVMARPLVAAVFFNAVIAISHAPFWVNGTLEHHAFHFWAHLLLFVAAMFMWFPVINRLEEFPSLDGFPRMIYLFIQSILPNVPAAFLLLATGVVYKYYATVPHPYMSAIEDQQLAGAIMKVGGTTYLWGIITIMFFRWVRLQYRSGNAAVDREASATEGERALTRRAHLQAGGDAVLAGAGPGALSGAGAGARRSGDSGLGGAGSGDAMPKVLTWDDVASELARTPPAEQGD